MAIARISNEIVTTDYETMIAFHEAFPDAEELKLPEGAQDYKLFEVNGALNGKKLPEGDDIVVILFRKPINSNQVEAYDFELVWYNDIKTGKPTVKTLKDFTIA